MLASVVGKGGGEPEVSAGTGDCATGSGDAEIGWDTTAASCRLKVKSPMTQPTTNANPPKKTTQIIHFAKESASIWRKNVGSVVIVPIEIIHAIHLRPSAPAEVALPRGEISL